MMFVRSCQHTRYSCTDSINSMMHTVRKVELAQAGVPLFLTARSFFGTGRRALLPNITQGALGNVLVEGAFPQYQ